MKDRTGLAVICLHCSAALYAFLFAFGVYLFWLIPNLKENDPYGWVLAVIVIPLGLLMVLLSEWLVRGMRRKSKAAWRGAVAVMALLVTPLLLPLGLLGLWGLLAKGTRRALGMGV